MNLGNSEPKMNEVLLPQEADEMIVTEGDQLTFIHIKKLATLGLIVESKAQFERIIKSQSTELIRFKKLQYPKVITQDARIVRYKYASDLAEHDISFIGLVNNWMMDIKVDTLLLELAAKKLGMTYKKLYDTAYRFDDHAPIEQRHRELAEARKLAIFDEVGNE